MRNGTIDQKDINEKGNITLMQYQMELSLFSDHMIIMIKQLYILNKKSIGELLELITGLSKIAGYMVNKI